MKRRFERLILSAALVVGACATEASKAPADSDLRSGKADGTLEIIEEGPLALGTSVEATLEANLGFSWTVTVDAAAELNFETSGDEGLDTIITVQDADGASSLPATATARPAPSRSSRVAPAAPHVAKSLLRAKTHGPAPRT